MTSGKDKQTRSSSSQAPPQSSPQEMLVEEALRVLVPYRGERDVVITNQGSAREWPKLSHHALDFHYIPSAMGGAVPLGLGIALAQSDRQVFVLSGDGSLLMNLGCLVSVVEAKASNLTIVLLDNGVYEITGGQRTPGGETNFAGIARACGFATVAEYAEVSEWESHAASFLSGPGPRFVWLRVQPVTENYELSPPGPIRDQLERLRQGLKRGQDSSGS